MVLDLVTQNPSFVILDSFGVRGERVEAAEAIWAFLCWEWSGPKTNAGPLTPLFQPPVTQQKEGHSCGVRLLMNIENILRDPSGYKGKVKEQRLEHYSVQDVEVKRSEIRDRLSDIVVFEKVCAGGLAQDISKQVQEGVSSFRAAEELRRLKLQQGREQVSRELDLTPDQVDIYSVLTQTI